MAAFCYDPIGQGERVQMLDDEGKAGHPRGVDDRAHDGGNRGDPGRPPGRVLPDLGWVSRPRLPGQPPRDRPGAAGLHRELGRRDDDRVPDGP